MTITTDSRLTCRHRRWTTTLTGSWVCVGCGADVGPPPLVGP
jgi:hypothetical protein